MKSSPRSTPRICVVGIGRIGLPLATLLAVRGYEVLGYDVSEERVEAVRSGQPGFYEPGLEALLSRAIKSGRLDATTSANKIKYCQVVIITVGTPWDENHSQPDFSQLDGAVESIGNNLAYGAVVILKSTVTPGTTENRVVPRLEELSGMKASVGFGVAFSPERTIEGRAITDFQILPKIVGTSDERTYRIVHYVLRKLGGKVMRVSSIKTAEMVKMLDNYNRASSIALVNKFAQACQVADVDVMEILDAAKYEYPRNSGLMIPGSGVGGSCLNKDPHLLGYFMLSKGVDTDLIEDLQSTNREMPSYAVKLVRAVAGRLGVDKPRVVVAGIAFKSGTDDTRYSPAIRIMRELVRDGYDVLASDPIVAAVPGLKIELNRSVLGACKGANIVLFNTDHLEYRRLDLGRLKKTMAAKSGIVDGRHVIDPRRAIKLGFEYEGVGRPQGAFH